MMPAWPPQPTLSLPTLLTAVLRVTPSYILLNQGFFYSDMLDVKVFMSILYSRATQLADRGPNPDLSSVETGPQAPR